MIYFCFTSHNFICCVWNFLHYKEELVGHLLALILRLLFQVVIGGDGSLTGADIFRGEWKSLLEELKDQGAHSIQTVISFPCQHNNLNTTA